MKTWLVVLLFLTCVASNANSAVIKLNGEGKIASIENYNLQTSNGFFNFDINFLDGTCIELVDGCGSFSNVFNFNLIHEPAQRILEAILAFTDTPNNINGCESSTVCNIFIPQQTFCCSDTVAGELLQINAGPNNEILLSGFVGMTRMADLTQDPESTYAVFSITNSSPNNPINASSPSLFALVSFFFLGIILLRKSRVN